MHKNKIMMFGILLMLFLTMFNLVEARKSFDEENNKYKTYDLLFFKKYDISLDTVWDSVINAYAEGELVVYKETKVFKKLYFKDTAGRSRDFDSTKSQGYKFYLNTSTLWFRAVNKTYEFEDCERQFILGELRDCKSNLVSWDYEPYYIEGWEEVDINSKIPEGSYKWKIEAKKPRNSPIDFIISTDDEGDLDKWAWWNSTFLKKQLVSNLSGEFPTFNVTFDSDMEADFDDLRFIDLGETTELNYTVRSNVSSTWAFVTVDSENASSIYMYYDNPTVTTTQINITQIYQNPFNLYQLDTSTPIDTTGHSDGTNNGATAEVDGDIIKAFSFDGSNDFIDTNFDQAQFNSFSTYVVFFRFKLDGDNNPEYAWDAGNTEFGMRIQGLSDVILWQIFNGAYFNLQSSKNSWNVDQWYTVALKYDSTSGKKIFIDNVLDNSSSDTTNTGPGDASDPFEIGQRKGGNNNFAGDIDEMIIINRDMTDNEIIELMSMREQVPTFGPEETESFIDVTLITPPNGFSTNTNSIFFSCNCSDSVGCIGLNMTIDNVEVNVTTGNGNLTVNYTNNSIPDGSFNWFCTGETLVNISNSTIFSFSVDSTPPILNITSPVDSYSILTLGQTLDLNYTLIEDNEDSCFFTYSPIPELLFDDLSNFSTTGSGVLVSGWINITDHTTQLWNYQINDAFSGSMDINIARNSTQTNLSSNIQNLGQDTGIQNATMNLSDNGQHYFEIVHTPFAGSLGFADLFRAITPTSNATNHTVISCSLNTTFLYEQNINTITLFANDTFGSTTFDTQNWVITIIELNQTFENETTEGNTETFGANIIIGGGLTISVAALIYNGSINIGSASTSGGITTLTISSVIIPGVDVDTNLTFFWSLLLSDGSTINLSTQTQLVLPLSIDNCSVLTNTILNFTNLDEDEQTLLPNSTMEIAINIKTSDDVSVILNLSDSFSTNPTAICITNLTNSSNYLLNAVIKYFADAHAVEYYNIDNLTIDINFTTQNINLFDLNESRSTEFQITFKGTDFLPEENVLVFVDRQYIPEDIFKTVELPKTDSNGQTVVHLVRNDIVYNLRFVKNGVLLGNFENVRAFCDDITIGDCKISLSAIGISPGVVNYDEIVGIIFTNPPTYNNATNVISFSFVSDDGGTKVVTLTVERDDIFGNRSICTNTLVSTSGVVSCNVGNANSTDTTLISTITVDGVIVSVSRTEITSFSYGEIAYIMWFLTSLILVLAARNSKNMMLIAVIIGYLGAAAFAITKGGAIGLGSAGTWIIVLSLAALWNLNKRRPN